MIRASCFEFSVAKGGIRHGGHSRKKALAPIASRASHLSAIIHYTAKQKTMLNKYHPNMLSCFEMSGNRLRYTE
jgi:hypothetical protein